jgi:hypothetical protein
MNNIYILSRYIDIKLALAEVLIYLFLFFYQLLEVGTLYS